MQEKYYCWRNLNGKSVPIKIAGLSPQRKQKRQLMWLLILVPKTSHRKYLFNNIPWMFLSVSHCSDNICINIRANEMVWHRFSQLWYSRSLLNIGLEWRSFLSRICLAVEAQIFVVGCYGYWYPTALHNSWLGGIYTVLWMATVQESLK